MVGITWYEAAHYCNWLSEQEGIPEEQADRESNESLHRRKIGRRLAISAKEVTRTQWRLFAKSQVGSAGKRLKTWEKRSAEFFYPTGSDPWLEMTVLVVRPPLQLEPSV